MKKTSKKQERVKKRNTIIVSLVMIFLMTFSILAISLDPTNNNQTSFEYNNFTFNQKVINHEIFDQQVQKYYIELNEQEIEFYFTPSSMNIINVSADNLNNIKNANIIYFTREPLSDELDVTENIFFFDLIRLEFAENVPKPTQPAVTNQTLFEPDMPVITCNDSSTSDVIIKLANTTGPLTIEEINPYCFEIKGNGDDLLYTLDYLLYKYYDVI